VSGHHLLGADRLPRCRPSGTLALAPASSPGAADRVRTLRDTKAGPRRNIAGDLLLATTRACRRRFTRTETQGPSDSVQTGCDALVEMRRHCACARPTPAPNSKRSSGSTARRPAGGRIPTRAATPSSDRVVARDGPRGSLDLLPAKSTRSRCHNRPTGQLGVVCSARRARLSNWRRAMIRSPSDSRGANARHRRTTIFSSNRVCEPSGTST
jgi:hypothetical protein